jgi:4-amino-4-deoxy-L-arabinose transferase-like glycosyltransferase
VKKYLSVIVVFFAALVFSLLFNGDLLVTDPVEANYALTAKEMLLSGDWLSPRIYGQFWFDKPIMIYWLIAAAYDIFGINEFAARFPAALFAAASVAWIYWFAGKLYTTRRTAFFAALVLATSLEFWILSRMIITDAVLFFFTSVSLSAFYLVLQGRPSYWYIPAYAAAGLAVLTKGPVGIVLPGLIVVVYLICGRRWSLIRRLQLVKGGLVFLLVTVPWYFAMYIEHGSDFINTFLGLHNVLRATVSEHPKDNVFYYYLVLFPVSILPWTGVFFYSFTRGGRDVSSSHFSYLMVWMISFIVFYSLMATKYLTYVFPAIFPAAILIGHCLVAMVRRPGRRHWLWLSVPAVFLFAILAAVPHFLPEPISGVGLYLGSAAAIGTILWLQFRGKVRFLPETTVLAVTAITLILFHSVLIPLTHSRSAGDLVRALPPAGAVVAAYGDYATSAVFYSGYILPQLVQEEQSPDRQDVWSGKYTMPRELIADFDLRTRQQQEVYILEKSADTQFITEPLAARFQVIASDGKQKLYKQMPGK